MKTLFYTLLTALALTFGSFATETNSVPATNAASSTLNNIKEMAVNARNVAATNINDAVIDILRGVKTAGGEVYDASKTAITKAVDFTAEQAPLVVREFLMWRLAESVIYLLTAAALPILLLFISRALRKRSEDEKVPESNSAMLFDRGGCRIFKWITRIVAIAWLASCLQSHIMTIAKITLAPRVYMIEYVVDNINTARGVPTNNNR